MICHQEDCQSILRMWMILDQPSVFLFITVEVIVGWIYSDYRYTPIHAVDEDVFHVAVEPTIFLGIAALTLVDTKEFPGIGVFLDTDRAYSVLFEGNFGYNHLLNTVVFLGTYLHCWSSAAFLGIMDAPTHSVVTIDFRSFVVFLDIYFHSFDFTITISSHDFIIHFGSPIEFNLVILIIFSDFCINPASKDLMTLYKNKDLGISN